MKTLNSLLVLTLVCCLSCNKASENPEDECPEDFPLLANFPSEDGRQIRIYEDGNAYEYTDNGCEFLVQYFDPGFFDSHYSRTDEGVVLKVEGGIFPAIRSFEEGFENQLDDLDFLIQSIDQNDRAFNSFTLQSPEAKSVADYVALRKCIINGTCEFLDNRFEVIDDPFRPGNQVLRFYAVSPAQDMVTSKSSISSGLVFFEQGDDFWFEADFLIDGPYPTTLSDFESSFFSESPGPRLILRNGFLAVENKFNQKLNYDQTISEPIIFPTGQWVKVTIHITYDPVNGHYRVWQDGLLIIDTPAQSMPFDLWIQDNIEVGISATGEETSLLVDNIRWSDQPLEN